MNVKLVLGWFLSTSVPLKLMPVRIEGIQEKRKHDRLKLAVIDVRAMQDLGLGWILQMLENCACQTE